MPVCFRLQFLLPILFRQSRLALRSKRKLLHPRRSISSIEKDHRADKKSAGANERRGSLPRPGVDGRAHSSAFGIFRTRLSLHQRKATRTDLVRHDGVRPFVRIEHISQKHVALFLSTKGHPDDYEILARAPQEFADDAFCALALAWGHELVAVPEVLDRMFYPERMDWYIERLRRVHPNAPRVLHFDKYSPVDYVAWAPGKKMRAIGFRSNKSDPCRNAPLREEAIEEWQLRLKALYGEEGMKPPYRGIDTPIFDCDRYPDESFRLVEELILNSSS